jgi:hypothetical protein
LFFLDKFIEQNQIRKKKKYEARDKDQAYGIPTPGKPEFRGKIFAGEL